MVELGDLEDNADSPVAPPESQKKRGDRAWMKFNSIESSSNESAVMVGYSSASSDFSSVESSLTDALQKMSLGSSTEEEPSAALSADQRSSSTSFGKDTLPGFTRSTEGPLTSSKVTTVTVLEAK